MSPRRRLTVDYMRMAGRRSNVHGLLEIDVTEARRRIRATEKETEERPSFTAFIVFCLAAAVEEHPGVQAYRDWRGRIHRFDEVDVNVLIETEVEGERIGVPHVIRSANTRSVRSIHDELRKIQESRTPGNSRGGPGSHNASLAVSGGRSGGSRSGFLRVGRNSQARSP